MSKHNVDLKTLLQEGLPEPEFCSDYQFRKIVGKTDLSEQLKRIVTRHKDCCIQHRYSTANCMHSC